MLARNNKNIIRFITLIYVLCILFAPYVLRIDVHDINGYLSYFEKIIQNTNLIPFRYNFNINIDILVKNIAIKLLMFFPLGMLLKRQYSLKKGFILFVMIAFFKELIHLITFAGYFDINDFMLYIIGFLMGWKLIIFKQDDLKIR